jgi:hypothetical protein
MLIEAKYADCSKALKLKVAELLGLLKDFS